MQLRRDLGNLEQSRVYAAKAFATVLPTMQARTRLPSRKKPCVLRRVRVCQLHRRRFAVFIFILWFWLFITTASDLFRRRDVSGSERSSGHLPDRPALHRHLRYIITQGSGMAARNKAQGDTGAGRASPVVGFSIAESSRSSIA